MNKMKHLGLYLHIPFCVKKCAYCDFYSVEDRSVLSAYAEALAAQLRQFREAGQGYTVDSVYFGGGTPSVLSGEQMQNIMAEIRSSFALADGAEITMEANPGTLDRERLAAYREAGICRISVGLQSADNAELRRLSRIHTREEFEESYRLAREAGFANINVDLMYALPRQTGEMLLSTLDYVLSLSPEHISFYGLKIEPNTPFGRTPALEKILPSEDEQADMYLEAAEKLENAGLLQYEISNFAKKGAECRHNLKYWRGESYLGFGPAAYSFFDGRMFSYKKDVKLFLSGKPSALTDEDCTPTERELATQFVMLGFRLRAGIDTAEYNARFHDDFEGRYLAKMKPFTERGYIEKTERGYRLSREGMLISNTVLSEILDFE